MYFPNSAHSSTLYGHFEAPSRSSKFSVVASVQFFMLFLHWEKSKTKGTNTTDLASCQKSLKVEFHVNILATYSGGQNIVDTLFMFYLHALTLGENNF